MILNYALNTDTYFKEIYRFGRHQKYDTRSYSYLLTFNLLNFHFPGYAGCLKIFKVSLKFHPFLKRITEKKTKNKIQKNPTPSSQCPDAQFFLELM